MAELKIKADSGGGTVSFKGPATTTSNAAVQLTLPVDDGAANQYLKTDGSGALSWATVSAGAGGASGLDLNDDTKIRIGDSQDLEIYYESAYGGNARITNSTGDLIIEDTAGDIYIRAKTGENSIVCHNDGQVELFHDNTEVVETDANGLKFADGKGITLGTDSDMTIRHSVADTTFNRPVSGAVNFYFEDNDATTNIPMRIGKTQGATNNERHAMFSFTLPGANRGNAMSGSSNSEAPAWAASSDYRIKENFRTYTGGWDKIKAIPVQLYDEKSPSYWTQGADKKDLKGWKAHEVQAVIPEAVTGTKDEVVTQAMIDAGNQYQQSELGHIIPQQLGTTAMIPDVIGALQQAMAKIETLETKVAALEAG